MYMIKTSKLSFAKQRALLAEMIRTDFKLRYQASALGYLWSVLKPLFLFAILYVVFTKFLRIGAGIPNYAISLLLGIVLWSFFIEATSSALSSVVSKGSLIRKIDIPRYLIPIPSVASAFINLILNLLVVSVFVFVAPETPISWLTLLVFPLLIIELTLIAIAVGFFLSAIFVQFRDMNHIWDVLKQALFYCTPIIYPLSLIPSELIQKIIMLNPLAQIIQDARAVVTYGDAIQITDLYKSNLIMLVPITFILVALYFGLKLFARKSKYFAEYV
jgi:ABC-2 type transport system permease protein